MQRPITPCKHGVIGIIDWPYWRPDYQWTRVENVWQEGIEIAPLGVYQLNIQQRTFDKIATVLA
jgi:hypothetical protein